jgi:hypothetical protein
VRPCRRRRRSPSDEWDDEPIRTRPRFRHTVRYWLKPVAFAIVLVAGVIYITTQVVHAVKRSEVIPRTMIEGEWGKTAQLLTGEVVVSHHTFLKDGRYKMNGKVKRGAIEVPYTAAGVWELQDGFLHRTIKESSNEMLVPVGWTSVEHVDSVGTDELVLTSSLGEKSTWVRER